MRFFDKNGSWEENQSSIQNAIKMIQEKGGVISEALLAHYYDNDATKNKPLTIGDISKLLGDGLAGAANIEPMKTVGRILNRLGMDSSEQAERFFDKYFHIEAEFKEFEFAGEKGFRAVCNLIYEKLGGLGQVGFKELYDAPECLLSPDRSPRKEKIVKTVMDNSERAYKQATEGQKQADRERGQLRRDGVYDKSPYVTHDGAMLEDFLHNREFESHRNIVYRYMKSFKDDNFTADAAMVPLRGMDGRSEDLESLKDTARRYFNNQSISLQAAEEFSYFYPAAST